MAVYHDGIGGYTTTEGTGPITITANKTGYRAVSSISDGTKIVGTTRSTTGFEVALYTKGTSGSNATLTRTQVYMNHSGTGSAVNWSAGEKEFHGTVSAVVLPALIFENIWLANQLFRQQRVCLDIDDDTYIVSTEDDVMSFFVGAVELLRLADGTPAVMDLRYAEASAIAGPIFRLFRNSPSPAANDYIGEFDFIGNNSVDEEIAYTWMAARIISATDGAEEGQFDFFTRLAGAAVNPLSFRGDRVNVWPGLNSISKTLLVGKTAQGIGNQGVELRSDGLLAICVNNLTGMILNRLNGDGNLVAFYRDSVFVGGIDVASGTVTYSAFVGHHPSLRDDGIDEVYPPGTIVCSTDKHVDGYYGYLPRYRISEKSGETAVYGVAAGCRDTEGRHIIFAVGAWKALVVGPVTIGDFIQTSHLAGVGVRQHSSVRTNTTLGRVIMGDNRTDIRLVSIHF